MSLASTVDELAPPTMPVTKELKTHNALIGDLAALNEAWDRDGYWFFRDVLDRGAVGRLRDQFVRELERLGMINPPGDADTEKSVRYEGQSLANFPFRMEPLAAREPWREFARDPAIHAFFSRLFQDEPFWVPIAEYRATPPTSDLARPRLDGIHQDGPYSPGIPFRICWIPLAEIDDKTGGLILAEGMTAQINRHPTDPGGSHVMIPVSAVPDDAWRRTTYRAGDLLMMNLWTPHSGVSNISDTFRLSMDHRIMAKGDRCPLVGIVRAISTSEVTVETEDGATHRCSIDDETYVRNHLGQKLSGEAIAQFYTPGTATIIAHDQGRASAVRPTH